MPPWARLMCGLEQQQGQYLRWARFARRTTVAECQLRLLFVDDCDTIVILAFKAGAPTLRQKNCWSHPPVASAALSRMISSGECHDFHQSRSSYWHLRGLIHVRRVSELKPMTAINSGTSAITGGSNACSVLQFRPLLLGRNFISVMTIDIYNGQSSKMNEMRFISG
jgi:hypothetical protein